MSAEAQLRRYHQLVQMLAALARSSGQVDAVVQTVHWQAGALFPAQVTLLALLEPEGDWRWELYEGEQRYTQRLPFYPEGILETVLRGEPLSIPDIEAYLAEHPVRVRRLVDHDEVLLEIGEEEPEEPVLSMLFVPLEVRGARVGVLSVQSYAPAAFDDTDLQFLDLLGQHVSIALENAGLREELERATLTDALTGLPNRRAFGRDAPLALERARREGRDLTLVMLDVHDFKSVNDTFGHPVGDAVLATLGRVFREALPAPGAAFRLSGDEFALLVWEAEDRLGDLARRIEEGLRTAEWPPGLGPVCLQGGAAQAGPGASLHDWLSLADARMYCAKRGRARGLHVCWGLDFGREDVSA
ncbi:GGDEF domain-containing protein [Deinococcus aerius]|nr:sensor domain-containing diguanylate cyclase [Deinococcus aerius]